MDEEGSRTGKNEAEKDRRRMTKHRFAKPLTVFPDFTIQLTNFPYTAPIPQDIVIIVLQFPQIKSHQIDTTEHKSQIKQPHFGKQSKDVSCVAQICSFTGDSISLC